MVKKHIAGTTMSAAMAKVEDLNNRKIPTSITFLSSSVDSKSRARYITITYLELIRRISRLGLKASVHIPSVQMGTAIDQEMAARNINEIIAAGNKYGVFVWLEVQDNDLVLANGLNGARGYGFAIPEQMVKKYAALHKKLRSAKILFDEGKEVKHSEKGQIFRVLDAVLKNSSNVVLSSPPEKIIGSFSNGSKYKGRVVLEFKLGYSYKKLSKSAKNGAKVSVNVPFGKDWVGFAMNRVPEGYMRFLASNLLNEKHYPEGV